MPTERTPLLQAKADLFKGGIAKHWKKSNNVARDIDDGKPKEMMIRKNKSGEEEEVRLAPKLLGGLTPPGGPFFFLRLVAYAFILLAVAAIINFFYVCYLGEGMFAKFVSMTLIKACLLAAVAAYSHEGLAKHVSRMAKHNDEYTALNDNFGKQIDDLSVVTKNIVDLVGQGEETMKDFEEKVGKMAQLSSMSEISTIARAYLDAVLEAAVMRGHRPDGMGEGDDVSILIGFDSVQAFLSGITNVLHKNIPTLNLKDFRNAAATSGISIDEVSLLLAACTSETEQEVECFVSLIYFYLEPEKYDGKVAYLLKRYFKGTGPFGTDKALLGELKRLLSYTAEKRVPHKESTTLTNEVLRHWESAEDEDLGVSDSSDSEEES